MSFKRLIAIFFVSILFVFGGCRKQSVKLAKKTPPPKKELVIYCENTMLKMVLELKKSFEKNHDCNVTIQNDCSKNLMGIIQYSANGDLYIPSSPSTFKDFNTNTGHTITDTLLLGYNNLVYMVKKGNPEGFNGNLSGLAKKGKFSIIIANPEASSLGYETKRFFQRHRVYSKVLNNVVSLTSDSKGLVKSLNDNQADLVINWESNINVNGNSKHVDIIYPKSRYNKPIPVYAATLSCSKEPELAKAFLDMTSSELSESRLNKFGFSKRQTIIF